MKKKRVIGLLVAKIFMCLKLPPIGKKDGKSIILVFFNGFDKLTFKGDRNMSCNRQKLNGQEKSDNKTRLVETSDYITTAYGSLNYYKCEKCGCDEILDYINFCPSCGREITD